MTGPSRLTLLLGGLALCAGSCSRVNLDAITQLPSDGSVSSDGNARSDGSASSDGSDGSTRRDDSASSDGSDGGASRDNSASSDGSDGSASRDDSARSDGSDDSASRDDSDGSASSDGSDGSVSSDASDGGASSDGSDGSARSDGSDGSAADLGLSVTCPSPALKAGDTTQTVQVGSSARTYILHVPSAYDGSKPVPLLLDFHAIGGTPALEQRSSPYPAQTDPEGAVMAFPAGLPGPLGSAWNVGPCCVADVDDVAFAKKLVEQVRASACIDPRRVYAVGTSMGGGMAYYLACRAADVFAAIAPSAFDLMAEELPDCTPPRPITVVSFRGTADGVVPYNGGPSSTVPGMKVTFLGAQGTFSEWAQIDQCTGLPSPSDSNGCSSYTSCQGGVEVILCSKQGGGQEVGNAAYAWPILKRHTL